MPKDPLSVLVKTSDQIAKMRERGELYIPIPHVPKPQVRDYPQLVKLMAFEAALVNRKEKTPEAFFHDFWRVFNRECLAEHQWIHTYLAPLRTMPTQKLSPEEKKKRANEASRRWREENPNWRQELQERKLFAREEAKRRRQGGYAVVHPQRSSGRSYSPI